MASISSPDARDLLGVDRHASPDDIRRAYRRAARLHHPDHGGDVSTFQQLVDAVDVLLDRADRDGPVATSPSTGRRAYPSTSGQYTPHATADAEPDLGLLDDARAPSRGQRWSPAGLAAAVVDAFESPLHDAVRGTSRRPGSVLNRFVRHLSPDLLASWVVTGATRRGVPGRDLEVVATFPPGARRWIDRVDLPPRWTTTRNPARTESVAVVRPGSSEAATAIRVADTLVGLCDTIAWPLGDWYRVD